jgi:hypothetical protein
MKTSLHIIQTVCLISVSQFLPLHQDKFIMVLAPGHAHLSAIKILHCDNALLQFSSRYGMIFAVK